MIVAVWLWRGAEVDKPALEPQFLQRVWYWDDVYDAVIGRPGQRLATFCAWVVDARVIDGAVNGTAHLAKVTGTAARKLQTGYARNYALGIALGHGPHHRLHAEPDVVGMTAHSVPFLTLLVLLPAAGAVVLGLLAFDKRLHKEFVYALALIVSLVTLGLAIAALVTMKVHDGGFQLVSNHDYTGPEPRRALVPRGGRHLHLPRAAHRRCSSRSPSSSAATARTPGATSPGSSCSRPP